MAWLVSLLYCSKQVSASALNAIYFMKKRTKFVRAFFLLDLSDRQPSLDLDFSDEFTDRGILQSCTAESVCHLRKLLERKTHSSEVSLLFINQGFLTFLMPLLAQVFLRCACSCISTINSMTFINFSKWEYWPYKTPLLVGCIHSQ